MEIISAFKLIVASVTYYQRQAFDNLGNSLPLYQFLLAAVTEHHKLSGLEQKKFIFSILEARSQKSRCQQGPCSLPFPRANSLCPLGQKRGLVEVGKPRARVVILGEMS